MAPSRLARWLRPRPQRSTASSFHLWWQLPPTAPLLEVSAVLEIVTPPTVDKLYFWALQVSFADRGSRVGAGHLGLQWNARHPGHGAVNWGGYASQGGTILDGSPSALPSARDDRNTRDYPWRPGHPYRLRVYPTPEQPGAWRGEVTDLTTGTATVVRDLHGGGTRLQAPVVWSEVFAACDDPSAAVRWSDLQVLADDGVAARPTGLRVNYQRRDHGGCPNTASRRAEGGVLQITNTERDVPNGALLPL